MSNRSYQNQGLTHVWPYRIVERPRHIPRDLFDPICYTVNENGCWVWNFGVNNVGYAQITHNKKKVLVHRLIAGILDDPLAQICHGPGCDSRCYRPEHLRIGNQYSNERDKLLDGNGYNQKLTADQVLEIKDDHLVWDPKTQSYNYAYYGQCVALAEKYGVNWRTISCIKTGKRWHWL